MRGLLGTLLLGAIALLVLNTSTLQSAPTADEEKKLEEAVQAITDGKFKEGAELARAAIKLDPKNAQAHYILGQALLGARDNTGAIDAFTTTLKLDPKAPRAHDRRGDAYLKAGKFTEAIADFDAFLEVNPRFAPEHWRRGIALYYAGKYEAGVKQFDLHRTVNPEDVENSAWHYLCNARFTSPKKAREDLLPVSRDARVPMKQVLELFAGKLKPEDVIAAPGATRLIGVELTSAHFYAHLYVALYYDAEKDAKKVREHLTIAVERHPITDYMWDVANAHLELLKAKK